MPGAYGLTDEENEQMEQMLQALEPEIKNMTGASPGFVRDQIQRYEQYGQRMFISPKQKEWLRGLYERHVGPISQLGIQSEAEKRRDVLGDDANDIDDEIPF